MQKYSYLLINILSILGPIILSFDKKIQFSKKWKAVMPGLFITSIVFLIWDILFTQNQVWSFNPNYIIGIKFWGLPLEEILFFITIPFSCLFIYECLNGYFPKIIFPKTNQTISIILVIISIVIGIYNLQKYYTVVNFTFLALVLSAVHWLLKFDKMSAFYRAYFICLIPFYIVNSILTSVPIVSYNDAQNLGIRVYTIPIEDHFYLMSLLLMNVYFYEKFKPKTT